MATENLFLYEIHTDRTFDRTFLRIGTVDTVYSKQNSIKAIESQAEIFKVNCSGFTITPSVRDFEGRIYASFNNFEMFTHEQQLTLEELSFIEQHQVNVQDVSYGSYHHQRKILS